MADVVKAIGVAGLGERSVAVARALAGSGRPVLVWDRDPAATQALLKDRPAIDIAGSLFDIGTECDVVLARADGVAGLYALIFGTEDRPGFGHTLEPDSIIVDLAPKDPRETRRLFPILGLRGLSLIDAAMLAGESEDARILAGGFAPTVARILPLLGLIGRAERSGELGSAHTLAILASALGGIALRARAEAEEVARRLHVEAGALDDLAGLCAGLMPQDAAALAAALAARAEAEAPLLRALQPEFQPAQALGKIAVSS